MRAFALKFWLILPLLLVLLVGIGSLLPARATEDRPTVLLFLSTECPVAAQYTPRLNDLVAEFEPKGVRFEAVFPNDGETAFEVSEYMRTRGYSFAWSLDVGGERAAALEVERVPTAVVLDGSDSTMYTGAIDDHKEAHLVKKSFLRDALAAVLAGEEAREFRTEAFGCLVMPAVAAPAVEEVNFAEHVAPIVYTHCSTCHRPGTTAPFSLLSYDDARRWAPMLADVTKRGVMPPWKAVEGYGDLHDGNKLTETEKLTIARWAAAGAPRGDASKEMSPPKFATGWELGDPDMIIQPEAEFRVPAEGEDIYRHFVIEPGNDEPLFVKGIDVRPGNPRVVHHVIVFLDRTDASARLEEAQNDGQPGYSAFGGPGFIPVGSLGGWAPGVTPRLLPEEAAFVVQPGWKMVVQVHYHQTGLPEKDLTQVGLYLTDELPAREVTVAWILNPLFRLQPGNAAQTVTIDRPIPSDILVYAVMPHMHLLGRSMKAWVETPEGDVEPLVWVDDWDFNWQLVYALKEPKLVRRGSRIRVEAVYDNSAGNPNNPNSPPKAVTWGEETTDEMCLLVALYAPVR